MSLDADYWSARMAHLAKLAGADAAALILNAKDGGFATFVAHNLPSSATWNEGPQAALLAKALAQRTTEQLAGVALRLADARTADALAVAPVTWKDQLVGALVALRVGRAFSPEEGPALSGLADLAGLELAEANVLRRTERGQRDAESKLHAAEEDRRLALALYELSRFATLGTKPESDLESAIAMLADSLHHDAVAVWANEEHKLRLCASKGYGPILPTEISTTGSDTILAQVLRERRTIPVSFGANQRRPDWAASSAAHFVLAPVGESLSGAVLGVLVVGRAAGPYSHEDAEFAATLGRYLSGMLQRSSTTDVSQQSVASERRRIAQELHDGLAQELIGVVLALEGCQRALERDPNLVGPQLAKAARDARATLTDVRQYMAALRQSDESGGLNLPVTIARLVDDLRSENGLHVDLEETGVERKLEAYVARAVIRLMGEALRNVAQHSGAANAKVVLRYDPDQVVVTVVDDGKGFDASELSGLEQRGHYGILGMRERVEVVGGQLVVRSEPGKGTLVRASIPYRGGTEEPSPAWAETPEESAPVADAEPGEKVPFLERFFKR